MPEYLSNVSQNYSDMFRRAELGYSNSPSGNTYRGLGSSWFNSEAIADENWLRDEQKAYNAFYRDLYAQAMGNEFSASEALKSRDFDMTENQKNRDFNEREAQKQRDYEERLANTAYQRAVNDMKIAGINPVLGLNMANLAADVPTGSTASVSGGVNSASSSASQARTSRGSYAEANHDPIKSIIGTLADLGLSLLTKGKYKKTKIKGFSMD